MERASNRSHNLRKAIWQAKGLLHCRILRLAPAAAIAAAAVAAIPLQPATATESTSVASRIPGATTAVRPVHVISRQDIERSGMSTILELLSSRNNYNNFGLYRPQLGATVYMIDGRRITGSNLGFVLEALPVPAVERIEFMADGAAALYGGGAGGAINIVLRHDFKGVAAWGGAERPAQKGGAIENTGAMWGGRVGRGRLTIGVDGFRRAEIRSRDRAFSRASWTEGGSFAGTAGVSVGGNTVFITDDDTTVARPLGACSGGGYTGPLSDPFGISGTGCGFAWADIAWVDNHERFKRYSLFANFDYPLGKEATFYAAARFAQGETAFRYAPPVGEFEFTPSQELRTQLLQDPEISAIPATLNVNHRFTAHGNRNWYTDLLEYDATVGMGGRVWGGIGYDMQARSHRTTTVERGGNFVSERLIQAAIADNSYYIEDPLNPPADRAEAHRQAIRNTTVRLKRSAATTRRTARLALNGSGRALPGGPLRWAAGLEVDHREERSIRTYRSSSGSHDVSDLLGTGGTSYSGERLRWSAFGELRLPLHRDWTVALAARHDRYDDVGATWSYQAASVWRLHKVLSLRGSWEIGQSPAGLSDLHASESIYYPRICDKKTFTGSLGDCPRSQVEAVTRGNPELKPDRRQTYTLGAKANLGKLSVSADWFRIEVSEAPGQLSTQKIVDIEASGQSLPAGAAVIREGNLITRIVNPLVNSGESETSGLDIRASARWKFDELDSGFDLRWLHVLDSAARVGGIEQPGDFPRNRVHATLSAGPGLRKEGWVADWNIRAVSGFSNIDGSGRFETWIGHDIGLDWRNAFGVSELTLRGGVFNLGDAGPSTDTSNPGNTIERYDAVRGRTFYLSLKAKW